MYMRMPKPTPRGWPSGPVLLDVLTGCGNGWTGVHSAPVVEFSFGKGREVHPLEALRRRLTRGLEIAASDQEVRRGGEVEALVTISSARKLVDVEVGVVCTEYYDEPKRIRTTPTTRPPPPGRPATTSRTRPGARSRPSRGCKAFALRFRPTRPSRTTVSAFPSTELVARGRRSRGLDRQARSEFTVLP